MYINEEIGYESSYGALTSPLLECGKQTLYALGCTQPVGPNSMSDFKAATGPSSCTIRLEPTIVGPTFSAAAAMVAFTTLTDLLNVDYNMFVFSWYQTPLV